MTLFSVDVLHRKSHHTHLFFYIHRYDEFDNKMFGISEIEAHRLDPQQRYVLECVHMALEDGGIPSSAVNGTTTGVFIGKKLFNRC